MISFKNVNFSYGDRQILNGFNLDIPRGDRVCFFAPSGSGKTTVLRLIMGLERANSGTLEGVKDKKISTVFQEDRLLPHKTVRQNIELFADSEDIDLILDELSLSDAANMYPKELSGGMARRTAIARALCRNADIYIFDEPFNGIDSANILKTAECIRRVTDGKTVLLVSHDKQEAEILGAEVIDL